jgi:hypothetical protein
MSLLDLVSSEDASKLPPLETRVPAGELPERFYITSDRKANVSDFIGTLLDFVATDSVRVSDTCREILVKYLNPIHVSILLELVNDIWRNFFNQDTRQPILAPIYEKFIDEMSVLIAKTCDRLKTPLDDDSINDLEEICFGFIDYAQRIPSTEYRLNLRIHLCQMLEVLLKKADQLGVFDTRISRLQILEQVSPWGRDWSKVRHFYVSLRLN